MSDRKWTAGPWEFLEGADNFGDLYEQSDVLGTIKGGEDCDLHICRIWNDINDDDEMVEERANAHLIAAAPEMYAALSELHDLMNAIIEGDYQPDSFTLQPARLALKRARGEE